MENDAKSPRPDFRAGDQVQIFSGKRDPDTGAERRVAVVWRDNIPLWFGDPALLEDIPGLVQRELDVRLPLKLHAHFTATESPLVPERASESPAIPGTTE